MNINLKTIQCLNKQALIAFECDAFPVNQDLACPNKNLNLKYGTIYTYKHYECLKPWMVKLMWKTLIVMVLLWISFHSVDKEYESMHE